MRAGSHCLSIFTQTLNARILRVYADGPLGSGELEATLGWAPQSSLRAASRKLREHGVLAPVEPGSADGSMSLTAAGRDLLPVADALEAWLGRAPDEPVLLDDEAGRGVVRVLIAAWDAAIVRALAERAMTLARLSAEISGLSYPATKRRLAQLRATRLISRAGVAERAAYEPSCWLREAVIPLSIAGQWERRHDSSAPAISSTDVEAAFLLALPLVSLPAGLSGRCACMVHLHPVAAGVALEAEDGKIVSLRPGGEEQPETWALGSADTWLEATIAGSEESVRIGGASPRLARGIVSSLGKAFAEGLEPVPT